MVDFRHAEDVVNVADDGQTSRRDEIGSRVARQGAFRVDIETLDLGGGVARHETAARNVLDRNEGVVVTLRRGRVGKRHVLGAAVGRDRSTTALFSRSTCHWRGREVEGKVLIALLNDKDRSGKVPRLISLRRRELVHRSIDQECVGQVIQPGSRNVGLLEDVATEPYVPALISPVRISPAVVSLTPANPFSYSCVCVYSRYVQNLRRQSVNIPIVQP